MNARSPITTHVLDTSRGCPAAGIAVELDMLDGSGQWQRIGKGVTDANGRITDLVDTATIDSGQYRLTFATAAYFSSLGIATFYPRIVVEFEIAAPEQYYHVPLLLSPYGYSTYRGS